MGQIALNKNCFTKFVCFFVLKKARILNLYVTFVLVLSVENWEFHVQENSISSKNQMSIERMKTGKLVERKHLYYPILHFVLNFDQKAEIFPRYFILTIKWIAFHAVKAGILLI